MPDAPPVRGVLERLKAVEHPAGRHLLLRGRGLAHRARRGHRVRDRFVDAYLAGATEPGLHFGCGPKRIPGWLNADLIGGDVHLDLERPLPYDDGVFAHAFGEHVIGALSERDAVRLFGELHRVLRPGGVLRLTTPDLGKLVDLYRDRHPEVSQAEYLEAFARASGKRHETACQALNDAMRLWGMRYTYDEDDLAGKLRGCGFVDVRRVDFGESSTPALTGIDQHGDAWLHSAESLSIEARRPA